MAFDAAEEVFDGMTVPAQQTAEVVRRAPIATRRDADHGARAYQVRTERLGIEYFVSHDLLAGQMGLERLEGLPVVRGPGASEMPTARPMASTTAASLVLRPPLVRPMAWALWPPRGLAASG